METKKGKCMSCGTEIQVSKFRVNRTLCASCREALKLKAASYEYKQELYKKHPSLCEFCGKKYYKKHKKQRFCSNTCFAKNKQQTLLDEAERNGEFKKGAYGEASRKLIRTYLEKKNGHLCSICGNSVWLGKPIPLIVDHIDGNAFNSKIENLRLVCANCDALLPTYKNKNRGHGRTARYKYQWFRRTDSTQPVSSN